MFCYSVHLNLNVELPEVIFNLLFKISLFQNIFKMKDEGRMGTRV